MILDVGCGCNPKGTVNIDLYLKPIHRRGYLNPHKVPNFIIADAHRLPLRDSCFTLVICDNVLEHLERPWEALHEFSRVAMEALIIVPNNPVLREREEHLYTWTPVSLRNLLSRFYKAVDVYVYTRMGDVKRSRLFKLCLSLPVFGKPLLRWLSRWTALEIIARCKR